MRLHVTSGAWPKRAPKSLVAVSGVAVLLHIFLTFASKGPTSQTLPCGQRR